MDKLISNAMEMHGMNEVDAREFVKNVVYNTLEIIVSDTREAAEEYFSSQVGASLDDLGRN